MSMRRKTKKVVNFHDKAFLRDKNTAQDELTDYFTEKNRQVKGAQLVSALKISLKKKLFSVKEAKQLADYLAGKFDIRQSAIQYTQTGFHSLGAKTVTTNKGKSAMIPMKKITKPKDFFINLFARLQEAVQENLLEYNGARVVVRDIVDQYPVTRDRLRR